MGSIRTAVLCAALAGCAQGAGKDTTDGDTDTDAAGGEAKDSSGPWDSADDGGGEVKAVHGDLQSMAVVQEVTFTANGSSTETFCATTLGVVGPCTCTYTYRGGGTLVQAAGSTNRYEGTWAREGTDCWELPQVPPDPAVAWDAAVQWSAADGKAFHSVTWTTGGTTLGQWVAHGDAGNAALSTTDPIANKQYWWMEDAEVVAYEAATRTAAVDEEAVVLIDALQWKVRVRIGWSFSTTGTAPPATLPEALDTDTLDTGVGDTG
ncbi:MAG: hypothetical protein H6732_14445 [Alphaproteobacteria bacterium]|nr:hypothetical protein [Alphaproteobacteria bacterium]